MEGAQKPGWSKAQEITFSVDLFSAAKQQLRFLAAVDNTGFLYDGPALERAIYRYFGKTNIRKKLHFFYM